MGPDEPRTSGRASDDRDVALPTGLLAAFVGGGPLTHRYDPPGGRSAPGCPGMLHEEGAPTVEWSAAALVRGNEDSLEHRATGVPGPGHG